jgi:hypothetical protein
MHRRGWKTSTLREQADQVSVRVFDNGIVLSPKGIPGRSVSLVAESYDSGIGGINVRDGVAPKGEFDAVSHGLVVPIQIYLLQPLYRVPGDPNPTGFNVHVAFGVLAFRYGYPERAVKAKRCRHILDGYPNDIEPDRHVYLLDSHCLH